jgi:hypothetical protein
MPLGSAAKASAEEFVELAAAKPELAVPRLREGLPEGPLMQIRSGPEIAHTSVAAFRREDKLVQQRLRLEVFERQSRLVRATETEGATKLCRPHDQLRQGPSQTVECQEADNSAVVARLCECLATDDMGQMADS